MNNDEEIPAVSQTKQGLDPNVKVFEVKCNPELNFAYVDVNKKNSGDEISSEEQL